MYTAYCKTCNVRITNILRGERCLVCGGRLMATLLHKNPTQIVAKEKPTNNYRGTRAKRIRAAKVDDFTIIAPRCDFCEQPAHEYRLVRIGQCHHAICLVCYSAIELVKVRRERIRYGG